MINYFPLVPILVSFIIGIVFVPYWIRKAKQIGLVWKDMNKFNSGDIAGSGGLITVIGFVIGVLVFIAYRTFYLGTDEFLIEILAMLTVILFLAGVGLIDDLFGWQKGGLSRRSRVVLVLLASVPLMAINAGRSDVGIPFLGTVDLGIFYPLILIPIGIIGAATTFNFLAGYNGLEAVQGILLLLASGVVALATGNSWLAVIAFVMVASLAGFLYYNYYPAKVFPGDSLTYTVGGLVAIIAILGNFEKIAVFFFIPYIIETVLKSRGKLKKYSFGKPNSDGSLDLKYNKIYSLNHVAILLMKRLRVRATEKRVTYLIWSFQLLIILIGLYIFRGGIFG